MRFSGRLELVSCLANSNCRVLKLHQDLGCELLTQHLVIRQFTIEVPVDRVGQVFRRLFQGGAGDAMPDRA